MTNDWRMHDATIGNQPLKNPDAVGGRRPALPLWLLGVLVAVAVYAVVGGSEK